MTRLTHLLSALTLAGGFAAVSVFACGPTVPGEMPRLAPRPEPVRPNAIPLTAAVANPSQRYEVQLAAQSTADQPSATADAGVSDANPAPLPPLRDGSIPADSRMEPILQRDGGK